MFAKKDLIRTVGREFDNNTPPLVEVEPKRPIRRILDDPIEAPPEKCVRSQGYEGIRGPVCSVPTPNLFAYPGMQGIEANDDGKLAASGGEHNSKAIAIFLSQRVEPRPGECRPPQSRKTCEHQIVDQLTRADRESISELSGPWHP